MDLELKEFINGEEDLKIRHFLNDALNNSLEHLGIKVNEEIQYNYSLEHDYFELLNLFEQHLKNIHLFEQHLKKSHKANKGLIK